MADTTRRIIDIADNEAIDLGLRDIGGGQYAEKMYLVNASDVGTAGTYKTIVNDVGGGVTYVGKAVKTAAVGDAAWQIRRITISGGDTNVQWAGGDDLFDKVWTARTGLTYP
jgi:hypothetical protein